MNSASVPATAVERPCHEGLVEHIMVDKKSGLNGLSQSPCNLPAGEKRLEGGYAAANRDLAEISILFHD